MSVTKMLRNTIFFLNRTQIRAIQTQVNPFGIEGEDIEKIVQGIYSPDSNLKANSQENGEPGSTLEEAHPKHEKYNSWIRDGEALKKNAFEKVYDTNFGRIRFDSENLVTIHGQFDPLPVKEIKKEQNLDDLNFETEEGQREKNQAIRNEYFLKQKEEFQSEVEETNEKLGYKQKKKLDEALKQAKIVKEKPSGEALKERMKYIYNVHDYENLTQYDLWNILRKQVLFENKFLIGLNKPYGLPMHSPSRECHHTLIQFMDYFAKYCNCEKVYPVHRLDKDTTGVMIFAKTEQASAIIKKKFADRTIKKTYLAITKNIPDVLEGSIEIPIGEGEIPNSNGKLRQVLRPNLRKYNIPTKQDDCKEAITKFRVIRSSEEASYMEIQPITGVKHQIRVHLAMGLGCPIIGDHKYSHRDKLAPQRLSENTLRKIKITQSKVRNIPLHLHCSNIKFEIPEDLDETGEGVIFIHARPPLNFIHTLRTLGLR